MLSWFLKRRPAADASPPPQAVKAVAPRAVQAVAPQAVQAASPRAAEAVSPRVQIGVLPADAVELALARADLPSAARRAALAKLAVMREGAREAPDEADWRRYLAELRHAQAPEAAFVVAEALAAAHQDVAWPLQELAALCGPRTPPERALSVGRRLHAALPTAPAGVQLVLQSLRALGRMEEANAFFAGQPEAVRVRDWYLVLAIREAWARQDWALVLEIGTRLRAAAPERAIGYTLPSAALRQLRRPEEAEPLITAGTQACPNRPDAWREAALVAQALGDQALAYARWAELHQRFPANPAGIMGAIQWSQQTRQPEETARLAEEGVSAFPGNRDLRVLAARCAMERKDAKSAEAHWRAAIAAAPDEPALAVQAAHALLGGGAGRQRRMPIALGILVDLNSAFPDYIPGCVAHLKMLRDAGRFDEADALCAAWTARFPDDHVLAVARARIFEHRGDVAASVASLEAVRARTQASGALEAAYARALGVAGEDSRADAVCADALRRFPNDIALLCEYPTLAMRRGDWKSALERAEASLRVCPGSGMLRGLLHRARVQIVPAEVSDLGEPGEQDGDERGEADRAAEASPEGTQNAIAAVGEPGFFLRFESLGATAAGCEFGIVQRRFGCEPLGLLRWAKIDIDGLTHALRNGFEGMGAAENTQLLIRDEGPDLQEYYVEDSRMGYSTHTFLTVQDIAFDRMLKQSQRRLAFLRGKLLEDLRAGEKIFVFKAGRRQATPEALNALFEALRGWSEATLLCVTMEDEAHPRGRLDMLRPGLFLGRMGSFMGVGRAGAAGIDTDQWRIFCERVAGWHDAARAQEAARPLPTVA
jgi:predicted Zn-dependent protease